MDDPMSQNDYSSFDHIAPMRPNFCFKAGRYAFHLLFVLRDPHLQGREIQWTLEIGHGAALTDFSKDSPAVCRESCKIFMNILLCGNHSKAWHIESICYIHSTGMRRV